MSNFHLEVKRGATTQTCTEEVFNQVIRDASVAQNCEMYRKTHEDKYKRQLPGICFHAWFTDGKRHEESAVPSGLYIFDIDKMRTRQNTDPRTFFKERVEPRIGELSILVAHVTPSDDGLRLVAPLRPGMNIEQSQEWLGKALEVEYDGCVKDLARLSFVVPEDHFLYIDRASLFAPMQTLPAVVEAAAEEEIETLEAEVVDGDSIAYPEEEAADEAIVYEEETYKGVPYRRIVEVLITRIGGEPVEGERNIRLFSAACFLRYICDFDADRLASILPRYGMSEKEIMSICKSAIGRPRAGMPVILQKVINDCRAELELNDGHYSLVDCMPMPKRLPPLVHQFVKTAPDAFKAPTVMALLPLMGAVATKLRFAYLDGTIHSPSFMTCVTGAQASGKSFIRRPEQILLAHIREQDEVERRKEKAYEEALRKAKNSKQQPEEPVICVRNVPVSISIAKLLKRLDNARGQHLISTCEEIDTVNKTNRAGTWSEKTDLMRNAFDNTEYGQDYMSSSSYSASLNVYYNLLFCGTPSSVMKFFKSHVTDGLISRTIFTSLPDNFGGNMPMFKPFTDKEMQVIADGITRLEKADGEVRLLKVAKSIATWLEEKRMLALETQSQAIETFRKRSAVIGYRAGALAYLLNEGVESRIVTDFACWVADYVLQQQVLQFGSLLEKEEGGSAQTDNGGQVMQLFSILPAQFTRQDLVNLRVQNNQGDNVRMIISRWKKNGMIAEVGKNTYTKLMRGSMEDFYHPVSA